MRVTVNEGKVVGHSTSPFLRQLVLSTSIKLFMKK